jgi:hypothetical protein
MVGHYLRKINGYVCSNESHYDAILQELEDGVEVVFTFEQRHNEIMRNTFSFLQGQITNTIQSFQELQKVGCDQRQLKLQFDKAVDSANKALGFFHSEKMSKRTFKTINLGLAIDNEHGLFLPVIKDAGNKKPAELRETINHFKQRAKAQDFSKEEISDATLVLSNFGSIAGRYAFPVIVAPTVAIIGIGKCRDEVVAADGQPAVHKVLPISICFDHRAATGGEAIRFLAAMIEDLQAAE